MVGHHCRMRARITGSIIRTPFVRREERETEAHARELLNLVGIPRRHQDLAVSLPYGDQRRLEIARALASGPEAAAARRADRGHEPAGVRGAARADGQAARASATSRCC